MSLLDDLDDDLFDDVTRPLLLGYLRRDLLSSDDEIATIEHRMANFARLEGYSMGYTYIERSTNYAALEALTGFVRSSEDAMVIIPSPMHFLIPEGPTNLRHTFERATGARVFLLDGP